MKILFTGLPYFSKKLVEELRVFDKKNTYYFCNTYYSKWDRVKFIFHLFTADRVVSFNGVSSKSGSLDWVVRFKKKMILQWQGSDVLIVQENIKKNQFTRKYIDYSKNFTDAEWIKSELEQLSITTELLEFKHIEVIKSNQPFKTCNVVTYLGDGNEKFYGLEAINKLAMSSPDIHFYIVGSKGRTAEKQENITYLGWVNQATMKSLMNTHAIFIRLTEHDGYSLSVLEAIANGNYVLWNNPHPCVSYAEPNAETTESFRFLLNTVRNNQYQRNRAGQDWAKDNLNREKILSRFVEVIKQ